MHTNYLYTAIDLQRPGSNVSTTPIMAMGCQQCLPLSVVRIKGKHCQKTHCRNGVVDRFEQDWLETPIDHLQWGGGIGNLG